MENFAKKLLKTVSHECRGHAYALPNMMQREPDFGATTWEAAKDLKRQIRLWQQAAHIEQALTTFLAQPGIEKRRTILISPTPRRAHLHKAWKSRSLKFSKTVSMITQAHILSSSGQLLRSVK